MMIFAAVSVILLSGFSVGTRNVGGIDISHLLLADNALIFYRAEPDSLRHLQCLLLCFEVVSCFKINFAKSESVPMGNVDNVDGLAGSGLWGLFSTFEVPWYTVRGLL
jgi:hypothetical protein